MATLNYESRAERTTTSSPIARTTEWEMVPAKKLAKKAPSAKAGKKRPTLKQLNEWMAKHRDARHRIEAENTRKHLGTPTF